MMGAKKAVQRIVLRSAVDAAFKKAESHPLVKGDGDVFLDLFDTGIVINLGKTIRKYYPQIAPIARKIIDEEIRKL